VALPAEITDGFSGETFYAARLQCTPHVQSWPNALLYLYGSEIVPNSIYETRYADAACLAIGDESCMSEPYYLHTGRWGDIIEPFASEQSTIQQPDFGDVSACVNKFKEQAGALSRTRVKLSGVVPDPNSQISFSDISHLVDAFRGGAYPYLGPTACP
jgi:hypothetical protein